MLIAVIWIGADVVSLHLPAHAHPFHWWAETYFFISIVLFSAVSWFLFLRKFVINCIAALPPPMVRADGVVFRCMLAVWLAMVLASAVLYGVFVSADYEQRVMHAMTTANGRMLFLWVLVSVNAGLMFAWLGWRRPAYEMLLQRQRGEWVRREISDASVILLIVVGAILAAFV